jgi:hypothetical protein
MRRLLPSLVIALTLVTGALSSPARAATPVPPGLTPAQAEQVLILDQQIGTARTSVAGWRAWLQLWSARIDQAELHASQARAGADGRTPAAARTRMKAMEDQLDGVLGSQRAVTAYQQLTGWTTQLQTLQSQRTAIINGTAAVPLPPGGPLTYERWAVQLLGRLGAPACSENVTALVTWQAAESTTAAYNPLATTHEEPGATSMNSVGVRNYVSLDQGLDATIATLRDGSPTYGYGFILDSLASCGSADRTVDAINASSWCAGCAFGGYVTNLLAAVRADYALYAKRLVSPV